MNNDNFINNIKSILDKTNNHDINVLYNDMSRYQKNIFDSWNNNINNFIDYSFSDLLFDFDKDFVEKILELELNYYLEKSLNDGTKNKKNGYTKDIALKVNNTEISINRPRLRNEANFDSIFVPKPGNTNTAQSSAAASNTERTFLIFFIVIFPLYVIAVSV